MSDQKLDYTVIKRNVKKQMRRQKQLYRMIFFWTHLIFFTITMLVTWGIVTSNEALRTMLFNSASPLWIVVVLPTVLWAFMLLNHMGMLYAESRMGERAMQEELLTKEVLRQRFMASGVSGAGFAAATLSEKRKRQLVAQEAERILLTDDGELSVHERDDEDSPKRQHTHISSES